MEKKLPSSIFELQTPCCLVDIDKVKENASRMRHWCEKNGIKLRPHMKTHKTIEGGDILTNGSRRKIVVSTLKEAEFYADNGFDDILYAYPLTKDKLERCCQLMNRLELFHIYVDGSYGVEMLTKTAPPEGKKWSVYLGLDNGDGREGVLWDKEEGVELAKQLYMSTNINFQGIYSHEGQSYNSSNPNEIRQTGKEAHLRLMAFVEKLQAAGVPCPEYSMGATPSCSQPDDTMKTVTEFHPGNYVFYDAMQAAKGSCNEANIACRIATRVIGHYPEKNHLLIDAGFLALSFDGKDAQSGGYGMTVQGHPELRIFKMTQEIGFIQAEEGTLDFEKYAVGSMIFIYPYHSCASAALFPEYIVHSGGNIMGTWKTVNGW